MQVIGSFSNPPFESVLKIVRSIMLEIPQEQRQTIFELATEAVNMAREASAVPQSPNVPANDGDLDMTKLSPLAAEIFKTLVHCHVENKRDRLIKDFQNQMGGGAQSSGMLGMPGGLGKI